MPSRANDGSGESGMLGEQAVAELREQTKWLRFLGLRALGPVLETALRNDRERLAYEMSDGRSSNAIGAAVGVSGRSILNWWTRWAAVGIAIEQEGGRIVRLASLSQLGIPVPAIATRAAQTDGGHATGEAIADEGEA